MEQLFTKVIKKVEKEKSKQYKLCDVCKETCKQEYKSIVIYCPFFSKNENK